MVSKPKGLKVVSSFFEVVEFTSGKFYPAELPTFVLEDGRVAVPKHDEKDRVYWKVEPAPPKNPKEDS